MGVHRRAGGDERWCWRYRRRPAGRRQPRRHRRRPIPTVLGAPCRGDGAPAEAGIRPMPEVAAAAEIEDHRRRHDGDDVAGSGTRGADGEAERAFLEPGHHPVGGGQSVRAATGQAHGVDLFDEVVRLQRVGLSRARPAASDIDAGRRSLRCEHHGGTGLPAASDPLVVSDANSFDVGDRAERQRLRGRSHRSETRWRD